MSDTTIGLDQIEEEMLAYEVSDAALKLPLTRLGRATTRFFSAPR